MTQKVADVMWEMLAKAGGKRCYGIVGDALNPVIDALRRNGKIEFVHVRHEEYGVFAAVAEAYLSGNPVSSVWNRRPWRCSSLQWADGGAQGGSSNHRDCRRRRDQHPGHGRPRRTEPLQVLRGCVLLYRAGRQS